MFCSNNSCWWIILILLFVCCGGCGNCGGGCANNDCGATDSAETVDVVDVTADADAATTAEAVAADNHTAKGAPSGLPIFL